MSIYKSTADKIDSIIDGDGGFRADIRADLSDYAVNSLRRDVQLGRLVARDGRPVTRGDLSVIIEEETARVRGMGLDMSGEGLMRYVRRARREGSRFSLSAVQRLHVFSVIATRALR